MINIAVMDSGVGGLSVLLKLYEKFNHGIHFIYVSDVENMPYGNKDQKTLEKLTLNNIDLALKNGADIIVVGCNTMSVSCENIFLEKCNVPVFFVRPDIEKIKKLGEENCLVLCTLKTASSNQLKTLGKGCVLPMKTLAKDIEENIFNLEKFTPEINPEQLKNRRYIFLGCTHYIFIVNKLEKICKNCIFYCGYEKILTPIEKLIKSYDLTTEKSTKSFIGSGNLKIKKVFEKLIVNNIDLK